MPTPTKEVVKRLRNIQDPAYGITAGVLIKILKKQPEDAIVVLSRDEEGNGFSQLSSFGVGVYVPNNIMNGEMYDPAMDKEYLEMMNDEEKMAAIVLWP